MSGAQPGWYADPWTAGGLRWWDGRAWSATTSGYHVTQQVAPFPLATYGSRAGGRILDFLLLQVVTWPLLLLVLLPVLGGMGLLARWTSDGSTPDPGVLAASMVGFIGLMLLAVGTTLALQLAYEVVLTAVWGMTLGKRAVGIRVRSIDEDRLPTWLESLLRAGVMLLGSAVGSGVFTLLDYLWPLWDQPWQQALHDKVAHTIVVPR